MNIDAIKNSESASFKKRNPHIFGPDGAGSATDASGFHGGTVMQLANAPLDTETKLAMAGLKNSPPKKKRIRQSEKPEMNRLEAEWFERIKHLAARPQAIKLKLARSVFYKPDFFSMRLQMAWEVKGLKGKNIDRGKLALKVAASAWPEIKFFIVWKDETGQWQEQHVLP